MSATMEEREDFASVVLLLWSAGGRQNWCSGARRELLSKREVEGREEPRRLVESSPANEVSVRTGNVNLSSPSTPWSSACGSRASATDSDNDTDKTGLTHQTEG